MAPYRTAQDNAAAKQWIYDNLGGAWAGFLNDPELGPLLLDAGYNRWTPEQFQARLQSTQWFRTHSDAERKFITLQETDPAQAGRIISEKQAAIHDWAKQMGLGNQDISVVAQNAVRYGWSDTQTKDILAGMIEASALSGQNTVRTIADQARGYAGDYFQTVSDDMALEFARRTVAGEMQPEDIQAYFRDRAKENYSYLGRVIDSGVTLKQYFRPHQEELSRLLEVAPEAIDFNDPKWRNVTRIQNEDGTVRAMTLTEVADYARSRPEWNKTQNAQDAAASTAKQLAQMMGAL